MTWIKAHVLPYDKGTRNTYIARALIHIASTDLIRLYEVNGEKYIYFPTWAKWQHPKYPTESKIPSPVMSGTGGEHVEKVFPIRGVGVGVERNRRGVGVDGSTSTDVYLAEIQRLKKEKGLT